MAFQKKCLGKMSQVAREGRTVLFVSHNMAAVQTLCDTALLLEDGQAICIDRTDRVLARYMEHGGEGTACWVRDASRASASLQFESAELRVEGVVPDLRLRLELRLATTAPHRAGFIAVDILNALGGSIMQALPTITPFIFDTQRHHEVRVSIELPPLIPGRYPVTLWVGSHNTETLDCIESALSFEIETSPTKNRTFGHAPDHGYIVPPSAVEYRATQVAPTVAAIH